MTYAPLPRAAALNVPAAELEKLTWASDRATILITSLKSGVGDVIVANCSRQERDSVSQTPSEGKCWHSESLTFRVCQPE